MGKVTTIDALIANRPNGKIVLCCGCFDLMHPGHIKHFQAARKMGTALVVSVTPNKYIDKGENRPAFDESLRVESIGALECVDYAFISKWPTAEELLISLKPDIYCKGQEFEGGEDATGKIQKEAQVAEAVGCEMAYTHEIVFSSTGIINRHLDVYPHKTRQYLEDMKDRYGAETIVNHLKSLSNLSVLIIGDTIVDEYHYCEHMGKSIKEPLIVNRYLESESFAGGAVAIANHVSGLCKDVHLVTVLGGDNSQRDFIKSKMADNITSHFFYRDNASTTIKTRYIDQYSKQKMFKMCRMENSDIPTPLETDVCDYLTDIISAYDLVMVCDFGHGLITDTMIPILQSNAKTLAINTQTNSANIGFNLITKFSNADFVCLDEPEARLASRSRYGKVEDIARNVATEVNAETMIVTRGRLGCVAVNNAKIYESPAFSTNKVVDRVGSGDAFFAFTAPCFAKGVPAELLTFIGNATGALAVQIVCNRGPVEPDKLYEFIETLLR